MAEVRRNKSIEMLEASLRPKTPASLRPKTPAQTPKSGEYGGAKGGGGGFLSKDRRQGLLSPSTPQAHHAKRQQSGSEFTAAGGQAYDGTRTATKSGGESNPVPSPHAGQRSIYLPIDALGFAEGPGFPTRSNGFLSSVKKQDEFDLKDFLEARVGELGRNVYQSKVADKVLILESNTSSMMRCVASETSVH
jgi:hypothetical protein